MPQPITEEELQTITKKVYALFAKHGFDGISMDEVSRQINISKATLYRYFTSKEDIVRDMADFLIEHLDSVTFTGTEDIEDVMKDLQEFYVKSVLIEALSGSQFLPDLEHKLPEIYEACRTSMDAMLGRFDQFLGQAVKKGFFRDMPAFLVSRQYVSMLPAIINMDYLEENGLTLPEAIRTFYRMFLCQNLTEKYLPVTEQEKTYAFADDLAEILLHDFFIDSIRR